MGISDRRVGTDIECPACGVTQTVPTGEEAAEMLAESEAAAGRVGVDSSLLAVYDVETPGGNLPITRTTTADNDASLAGRPIPYGMILFPRHMYYVQAILALVLAGVCFVSGYYMGQGDANYSLRMEQEAIIRLKVNIEGTVFFDKSSNEVAPDADSVVMILPELPPQEIRKNLIPSDQMGPDDPVPGKEFIGRKIIEQELEGIYTRVDQSGSFFDVLPDTGNYFILIISKNTIRPPDEKIDEADVIDMKRYFRDIESLIDMQKYEWKKLEVGPLFQPLDIDFGLTKKDTSAANDEKKQPEEGVEKKD